MKLRVLLASAATLLATYAQAQYSGVLVQPSMSGDWDTVHITVNTNQTCPRAFGNPDSAKSLATSTTLRFHGGVCLKSGASVNNWQRVRDASPTDTNTHFKPMAGMPGIFHKMIVPATYFTTLTPSDTVVGLAFVMNGGPAASMWDKEGKVCNGLAIAANGDHIVVFSTIDSAYLDSVSTTSVKTQFAKFVASAKPNPFVNSTTVTFTGSGEATSVKVYNTIGAEVATLFNGVANGEQAITWNGTTNSGTKAGNGMYIIRVQTGNRVDSRSVIKLD